MIKTLVLEAVSRWSVVIFLSLAPKHVSVCSCSLKLSFERNVSELVLQRPLRRRSPAWWSWYSTVIHSPVNHWLSALILLQYLTSEFIEEKRWSRTNHTTSSDTTTKRQWKLESESTKDIHSLHYIHLWCRRLTHPPLHVYPVFIMIIWCWRCI